MRANAGTADSIGAALNNSLREPLCLRLIDAWMAVARRQPDARHKLEHADSLAMEAHEIANVEAPIIVARMWESLGELQRALTACRHATITTPSAPSRQHGSREKKVGWPRLPATSKARFGRIGDFSRCARILKRNFRPEVDRVKKEVDRLLRETAGR